MAVPHLYHRASRIQKPRTSSACERRLLATEVHVGDRVRVWVREVRTARARSLYLVMDPNKATGDGADGARERLDLGAHGLGDLKLSQGRVDGSVSHRASAIDRKVGF